MKYFVALLVSILSVWLFYFLVAAFFVQFEAFPIVLVWLANIILFVLSNNVRHILSRFFFLIAIESMVPPLAAFLHTVSGQEDLLGTLLTSGQDPALIRYFVASGYDIERVVMTSLGFTLIFSLFAFFLSPETDRFRY
ncbi:MAG: hypothetical protein U0V70_05885 [Terriglobia bacterium]